MVRRRHSSLQLGYIRVLRLTVSRYQGTVRQDTMLITTTYTAAPTEFDNYSYIPVTRRDNSRVPVTHLTHSQDLEIRRVRRVILAP